MSIHLTRKKILCISFFLCCVLPACFTWYEYDAVSWNGLSSLELPLLIGTLLFAFALLFERPRYNLPLGILSHVLLLGFLANSFLSFPVVNGIAEKYDIALSFDATCPAFWVAFALLLVHLVLFTTTEIAVQKLSKQSASQRNSTH